MPASITDKPHARKAADLTSSDVSYSRKRERTSNTRYRDPTQNRDLRSSAKLMPMMTEARTNAARLVTIVKRTSALWFDCALASNALPHRIAPTATTPIVGHG